MLFVGVWCDFGSSLPCVHVGCFNGLDLVLTNTAFSTLRIDDVVQCIILI